MATEPVKYESSSFRISKLVTSTVVEVRVPDK
jgi:hypothetical protein